MKKLITLSYTILCMVLLILCYMNFSYDVIENIQNEKQKIVITKEKLDIMYKHVETDGNDLKYYFYCTNNTYNFIDKESANILPNIAFYDLKEADSYDLTTSIFYADKSQCDRTINVIQDLGYTVTTDTSVEISGKISVPTFATIPIVLVIMSMIFYVLSIGKKTVLRKMEGYTTLDILKDEFYKQLPMYAIITALPELITIGAVLYNYNNALTAFFKYEVNYILLGGAAILIGMILSCIVIYTQNKAAYIKGKVPRKGMYVLSMISMIVFIIFIDFFMTIAIRNVKLCYHTYKSAHFMANKIDGYVTIPIYENNASSDGMEDNYMEFYKQTVNEFQGVLINAGNYQYDLISGTTMCEEYAELVETGYNAKANFIEYDSKKSKIYSYNAAIGNGTYGQIDSHSLLLF
ncbi:MAG: hypothetical protein HDT39_03535 [Lachnospiraceae bacterium]|nr:hypothetical protein [Lachnospiraceae bacterium]